jgi:hypothetical protein
MILVELFKCTRIFATGSWALRSCAVSKYSDIPRSPGPWTKTIEFCSFTILFFNTPIITPDPGGTRHITGPGAAVAHVIGDVAPRLSRAVFILVPVWRLLHEGDGASAGRAESRLGLHLQGGPRH